MSLIAPRGLSSTPSSRAPSSKLNKKALRVLAYQAAKLGGNLPEPKLKTEASLKTVIPDWMVQENRPGIARIIDQAKQQRTPKRTSMAKAHQVAAGITYSSVRHVGGAP